jgi:hypothetical protein
MRMPANWLEWLGVVGSGCTIIALALYLLEVFKRKKHETMMLGFLHGVKPLVEIMSARPETTGKDWQPLLLQVNHMLARLQPQPDQEHKAAIRVWIVWGFTVVSYLVARLTGETEQVVFGILTALLFMVGVILSVARLIDWEDTHKP